MVDTVYKYELEYRDRVSLELPINSKLLHVGTQLVQIRGFAADVEAQQKEILCLWALVDTEETQKENVRLHIYGTGHPIDHAGNDLQYVGTVQQQTMALVWHIFREIV